MRLTYRGYLLTILIITLAINNMDRMVFGLVLQEIKFDLQLSDTQLGFLSGIAFALFYAVMGIPIARWADRGDRVTIIAIATAVWSAAVALCGAAGNYLQLLLIRITAATGEAGCVPPAHSLIADYFSRTERPQAASRFMLGIPISIVLGNFVAGWLNEFYGWRATFIIVGLPGIALAVLVACTLREPRREARRCSSKFRAGASLPSPEDKRAISTKEYEPNDEVSYEPSIEETALTLWRNRTFRYLLSGYSVMSFFGWGIQQWQPAFFIRSFGLQTGELGTWFMLIGGVFGFLGTYAGGEVAARHAAHNEPLQLKAIAIAYGGYAAISILAYLSTNKFCAFGLMAAAAVVITMAWGPLLAIMQTLVPPRMRAMSIALVYFCANLIGMGLGPLVAGVLSDQLRPWLGEESLRYALLALWPGFFIAAWFVWQASKIVGRDLTSVAEADHDMSSRAEDAMVVKSSE